jgi:tRNA 2-thiocytidine biosynthesis protein TtcA
VPRRHTPFSYRMHLMKSLQTKLSKAMGRAVIEYGMIEEGDRVAVAVSGGKDSLALLDILMFMQRRAPINFELIAVTIDQGYEGFKWPEMEKHFKSLNVPYHIENTTISDIIDDHKAPGATWCSLCARLRRGVLYRLAREKGWTKIALGHHADDLIETLMLSQLFNGTVQSMPPILKADDGINVVIRPMVYVWEEQVIAYAKEKNFPIICCACPACTDLTLKRRRVKAMLQELDTTWPGIKRSLLTAHSRVKVTQMMDPRFLPLGDKAALRTEATGIVENEPPEDELAGRDASNSGDQVLSIKRMHPRKHEDACNAECACGPVVKQAEASTASSTPG